MRTSRLTTLLSLLVTAVICAPTFAKEANLTPVNNETKLTDERKESLIHLLKQDCGSCHGMTLKGGLGPALLPENLKNKPTALIENTILFGRPSTAMPPWQGILTKKEVSWLTKQLQNGTLETNANNKNLDKKDTLNESH